MPTYTINDEFILAPLNPNPEGINSGTTNHVYKPKPKSFYLAQSIRALKASGKRLYNFADGGSTAHRFLDSIAWSQGIQDRIIYDGIRRGIAESVYKAYIDSGQFEPRRQPRFASGLGIITRAVPAPTDEIIPANTFITNRDGSKSAITTEQATITAGTSSTPILIRAEAVGVIGNAAAGELNLIQTRNGSYGFKNQLMDGGKDEESDEDLAARFALFINSLGTSTPSAIETAGLGASFLVGSTPVYPRSITLVNANTAPSLAIPPGVSYVVVEEGGGVVSDAGLLSAVYNAVKPKYAEGIIPIVVGSAAFVISFQVSYQYFSGYNTTAIEADINTALGLWFTNTLPEQGLGRGRLTLNGLDDYLKTSNTGIYTLKTAITLPSTPLSESAGEILPPIGSRAIPSVSSFVSSII
jgi:hypothetical protein